MNTVTKTTKPTRSRKAILVTGIVLIVAIWIATFAAIAIMQPDIKTRMLIAAAGAGATELILYAGAAWFGVTLFQRFRSFIRFRK
jgi:hypothetical protein